MGTTPKEMTTTAEMIAEVPEEMVQPQQTGVSVTGSGDGAGHISD